MAINVATSFKVQTNLPIDERLVLTKEQMLNANDNTMPETYMATCTNDGNLYIYKKTNTADPVTGKFRIMTGGSDEFTGTKAEWEALTTEEKAQYDGKKVNITDDVQDEISGMKLLWTNPNPNDAFNAQTVTFEKNDYKAYLINVKIDEAGEYYITATVFVGYGSEFVYIGGTSGPTTGDLFSMSRLITASSDNSVTFENMAQWFKAESYTADQKRMVPYQIYGIK